MTNIHILALTEAVIIEKLPDEGIGVSSFTDKNGKKKKVVKRICLRSSCPSDKEEFHESAAIVANVRARARPAARLNLFKVTKPNPGKDGDTQVKILYKSNPKRVLKENSMTIHSEGE